MVIDKFPYIFIKFVKSSFALVKRNKIFACVMTHEEISSLEKLNCFNLTRFFLQNFIGNSAGIKNLSKKRFFIFSRDIAWLTLT